MSIIPAYLAVVTWNAIERAYPRVPALLLSGRMRASRVCHCGQLMPCAEHERKPWADSTRRQSTLNGWQQQKRARRILRIHHDTCHVCGLQGADQVDHVIPLAQGGADDDTNCRPIHRVPCHADKTQAEAGRGKMQA